MRVVIAVAFAAALVVFAAIGHHVVKPNVTFLPRQVVSPRVCEHRPFKHGYIESVQQYGDDPAVLHVRCGDGTWVIVDK